MSNKDLSPVSIRLVLKKTAVGKGVFTRHPIEQGSQILVFQGPVISRSDYIARVGNAHNYFLQVDFDKFMGPSGDLDDFINHSCDPNSGLIYTKSSVLLYAIRDIKPGEEVCFDYSTTMNENFWEMDCICQTPVCRKIIKDFKHLPRETKQRYISLGIVPQFVLEAETW